MRGRAFPGMQRQRPRVAEPRLTLLDRLSCALLGAVFGVVYGAILAVIVGWMTDGRFGVEYVCYTTGVFASMGLVLGPFIGDVIGGVIHFFHGIAAGILFGQWTAPVDPEPRATGWLRSLFLFGVGTGVALYLAWRVA